MEVDQPNPHTIKRKAERQRQRERNEIAGAGRNNASDGFGEVLADQDAAVAAGAANVTVAQAANDGAPDANAALGSPLAPAQARCHLLSEQLQLRRAEAKPASVT